MDRAAARLPAPVIYVDHNPTGEVLGVARRRDAIVVEDLAQAGLDLEGGRAQGCLAAADDSVIAVGSLSKMFWAGLRVGWLRAPAALHGHLLRLRSAATWPPACPPSCSPRVCCGLSTTPGWTACAWPCGSGVTCCSTWSVSSFPPGGCGRPGPGPRSGPRCRWPRARPSRISRRATEPGRPRSDGLRGRPPPGRAAAVVRRVPADPAAAVDRLTAAWKEHTRRLAAGR